MTHMHRRATPLVIAFVLLVTTPDGDRLSAQAPAASQKPLQFEVASVKPTLSPAEAGREAGRRVAAGELAAAAPVFFGIRTFPGGRLSAVASLRGLIARAYNVKDYQIEGGPAWASSDYFSIEARAGSDATTAEFNEMLKALLVERFSLRAHIEARQGKVYALTFARSDRRLGSGLKRTSDECLQRIEERKKTPPPPGTPSGSNQALRWSPTDPADCGTSRIMGSISSTTLSFSGQPMSALVDHISGELAAPVVDRTGLDGVYDVVVEYEPRAIPVRHRSCRARPQFDRVTEASAAECNRAAARTQARGDDWRYSNGRHRCGGEADAGLTPGSGARGSGLIPEA